MPLINFKYKNKLQQINGGSQVYILIARIQKHINLIKES